MGRPPLCKVVSKFPLHQAQPIAVNEGTCPRHPPPPRNPRSPEWVVTADSSTMSLTPAAWGGAHGVDWVDLQLDVQPVVPKQHYLGRRRVPGMAAKLRWTRQPRVAAVRQHRPQLVATGAGADGVQAHVLVAGAVQGHGLVEKFRGPFDDDLPPCRVVACALLPAWGPRQHIGAVEGVIEAGPTGVGGVEGVAGVHHRHHELRAGQGGDFRIHIGGFDGEIGRRRNQIADFRRKALYAAASTG